MFGAEYTAGCPSCSAIADGFDGSAVHLANHDVTLSAVSRAPLAKLQAYKRRMGWSFPWASSSGSDFNHDFQAANTKEEWASGAVEYNFREIDLRPTTHEEGSGHDEFATSIVGTDWETYRREGPGVERVLQLMMTSCTTPTRRMRAGWTASGACTSGSIARHSAATRLASGGAATTSTTASDGPSIRVSADDSCAPQQRPPCVHSFRATSGPVIRFRSGNVEAMIASDAASPPRTVAQYAIPGIRNATSTCEWR